MKKQFHKIKIAAENFSARFVLVSSSLDVRRTNSWFVPVLETSSKVENSTTWFIVLSWALSWLSFPDHFRLHLNYRIAEIYTVRLIPHRECYRLRCFVRLHYKQPENRWRRDMQNVKINAMIKSSTAKSRIVWWFSLLLPMECDWTITTYRLRHFKSLSAYSHICPNPRRSHNFDALVFSILCLQRVQAAWFACRSIDERISIFLYKIQIESSA